MLYSHHEIVRSYGQGPVSPSYALRTSHQWTSVLGRIARGAHTSSRSRTRDSRLKHQHWSIFPVGCRVFICDFACESCEPLRFVPLFVSILLAHSTDVLTWGRIPMIPFLWWSWASCLISERRRVIFWSSSIWVRRWGSEWVTEHPGNGYGSKVDRGEQTIPNNTYRKRGYSRWVFK